MVSYIPERFRVMKNVGLNPCCNGRWSRTLGSVITFTSELQVLILVVMEDGLVQIHYLCIIINNKS